MSDSKYYDLLGTETFDLSMRCTFLQLQAAKALIEAIAIATSQDERAEEIRALIPKYGLTTFAIAQFWNRPWDQEGINARGRWPYRTKQAAEAALAREKAERKFATPQIGVPVPKENEAAHLQPPQKGALNFTAYLYHRWKARRRW